MTAPTFFKPTDLSTDPTGTKVGGGNYKYLTDVLDGTHATDRIQQLRIEGLNPMFGYRAIVYKDGSTYKAYSDNGSLISSNADAKTVLQAAIDHVSGRGGGKVFLKDAVYDIASQWNIPSKIELWGESREGTILKSTSALAVTQMRNTTQVSPGNEYITLGNLTIDHINGTGGAVINWTWVQRSTVFNCHIKNGFTYTFFWTGSNNDMNDNIIINNIIDCDERTPTKPEWDMWAGGNLANSIMTNNIFRNGGGSGNLVVRTPRRLIVANNIVYGNRFAGISLETSYQSVVANNVCYNNGAASNDGDGIKINDSSHGAGFQNIIVGNWCEANYGRGIQMQGNDITIADNFCIGNAKTGIECIGDRQMVSDNICLNNGTNTSITANFRAGIRLTNSSNCKISGNECLDLQGTPTQLYGIVSAGTSNNNHIHHNIVAGYSTGTAMELVGTTTIVKDNPGYNPQGVATQSITSGVAYTNSDRVPEVLYMFGGTITNVTKNAIQIANGPVPVWLEPNESVTITFTGTPTFTKDRK